MMCEYSLVYHCAPTLAGIKTANLFTAAYASKEKMILDVRRVNHRLREKGVRLLPLRYNGKDALLYIYRPCRLQQDLCAKEAAQLLHGLGYAENDPNRCLVNLAQRLQKESEFPHEIGLFLGYPPEDVYGFIQHKAAHSKCTGCWKVYGDAEKAQRIFCQYQKCTRVYCDVWQRGTCLERLTVPSA